MPPLTVSEQNARRWLVDLSYQTLLRAPSLAPRLPAFRGLLVALYLSGASPREAIESLMGIGG